MRIPGDKSDSLETNIIQIISKIIYFHKPPVIYNYIKLVLPLIHELKDYTDASYFREEIYEIKRWTPIAKIIGVKSIFIIDHWYNNTQYFFKIKQLLILKEKTCKR